MRPAKPQATAIFLWLAGILATHGFADEPQRLTQTGRLKFSPVYRDGGREVIFVELTDPSLYRLQKLTVADGTIAPLHPEATTTEFEPSVAADGQCYAYLRTQGTLSIAITIRDPKGEKLGELPAESGFFGYRSPAVAPQRARVAYAYPVRGAQQIYSAGIQGDDRKPLTDTTGINNWPAYSPDGQWIAFGSSREGDFEIYLMRADGSDVRRLTESPFQDIRPRFSPDGNWIAFTSHRDGNAEIYVMRSDGSRLKRVTQHAERDDYPDWHPDGRHVIGVGERQGKLDIYVWDVAALMSDS